MSVPTSYGKVNEYDQDTATLTQGNDDEASKAAAALLPAQLHGFLRLAPMK